MQPLASSLVDFDAIPAGSGLAASPSSASSLSPSSPSSSSSSSPPKPQQARARRSKSMSGALAAIVTDSIYDAGLVMHADYQTGGDQQRGVRTFGPVAAGRRQAVDNAYIVYCLLAAFMGFIGFALTLLASYDEVCGVVDSPSIWSYREGTLTRWPATVSELNSDWSVRSVSRLAQAQVFSI
jgi:hypothetical protein